MAVCVSEIVCDLYFVTCGEMGNYWLVIKYSQLPGPTAEIYPKKINMKSALNLLLVSRRHFIYKLLKQLLYLLNIQENIGLSMHMNNMSISSYSTYHFK